MEPPGYNVSECFYPKGEAHSNNLKSLIDTLLAASLMMSVDFFDFIVKSARAIGLHPERDKDERGRDLVGEVAKVGNFFGIRALLNNGFRPDIKDNSGKTPLHIAAKHGHLSAVLELLIVCNPDGTAKSSPYTPSQSEESQPAKALAHPIHLAAAHGHAEIVEVLLERDFSIVDKQVLRPKSAEECSLLHFDAMERESATIEVILKQCKSKSSERVDIDTRTSLGYTPLMLAACYGSARSVRLLIDARAQIGLTTYTTGFTALHLATYNGNTISFDIVDELLLNGADPESRLPTDYRTPFHLFGLALPQKQREKKHHA